MRHVGRRLSLLGLLLVYLAIGSAAATTAPLPDIVLFYSEACPQCKEMDATLEELQLLYPRLQILRLEVSEPGITDLLWELSRQHGVLPVTYPVIFVGDQAIVGSGRARELLLRNTVRQCMESGRCVSPLERVPARLFPWSLLVTVLLAVLVFGIVLLIL